MVRRSVRMAYNDEPLTLEEIEAMEEGIAGIRATRICTLQDIMKEFSDDKTIL